MIASPEKLADMKARRECLDFMEFALSHGHIEIAKKFGETSRRYVLMLKGDYTERDKKWEIYNKFQMK